MSAAYYYPCVAPCHFRIKLPLLGKEANPPFLKGRKVIPFQRHSARHFVHKKATCECVIAAPIHHAASTPNGSLCTFFLWLLHEHLGEKQNNDHVKVILDKTNKCTCRPTHVHYKHFTGQQFMKFNRVKVTNCIITRN